MRCSVHIIIALFVLLNIDTVHSSGDDNQDAVQSTQNTVRLMIGPESVQQQIQVTETAVREYSDLTNTNLVRKNGVLLKLESDETFTEPVELKVTTLIPFSVVVPNVSFQTTLKDIDLESMKVLTKPEFSSVGELAKEKCKSCQYTKIVFPEARTSEVTLQLPALNKKKLQDVYTSPAGLYMYLDDSYALLESLIIRNIPAIKTMTTVAACTFDDAERNVAGMKAFEHLRNLRKGKNSSQGILDWSVSSAKENPKDWTFTGLASGSSTTNKNFKYVTVQLETAAGIEIEKTVILGESSNSIYVASTKVGTQPEHNLYFLSGTLAAQDHAHSILVVLFYNNSLITRVFVYEVVMSTGTTSMTCYAVEKSSNMMCDFLFAFENDYRDPHVQLILTSSPDASSLGLVDFRLTSCLVPRERQRELRDVARFSKIVFFENQLSSEVSETDIANLSKTIESAKLRAEQQVKQRETNLTAKITNVSQNILDRSKLIKDAVEQAKKDNEEQETKKEKSQAEEMEGLRRLMKEAETRMEELRANKEKVNEQRNKIQNFLDEFQSFLDTKKEDIDNKPEVKDALSKAKEMQELQEKVEEEIKSQDQKKNEYSQSLKEIESFVQDFSSRIAASQTREKELEDIIKAHEDATKSLPANTKWKGGLVFVALAFIATVIAFIVLLIVQPHMASRGLTSAPN